MKMKNKRLLTGMLSAGAALALTNTSVHAEVVYTQTFEGTSEAIGDCGGFTAFRDDGTEYTASTDDPVCVNLNNGKSEVTIASAAAYKGGSYALISGADSIDPNDFANDLTVSFHSFASDDRPFSPEMGWRVLATVGSTIYASDFIKITTTTSEKSVVVSDAVWHVWAGETDLSDGFNIDRINGGAGITLPAGTISDFGVLVTDGAEGNNDRLRLKDFSLSGTFIAEPETLGLITAFSGGIIFIRHRLKV